MDEGLLIPFHISTVDGHKRRPLALALDREEVSLWEQIKGPTATIYVDGYLSGPSAQLNMSL
jgi:hypothetical protein